VDSKQVSNVVKSILGQGLQKKYVNVASVTQAFTSSLSNDHCATPIGTTEQQRIGNRIHVKHFSLRFQVILGDTTQIVRLLVFRWRPDTGSDAPSLSEIVTDTGSNTRSVLAPFLMQNPSRFDILVDRLYSMDAYHQTFVDRVELPLNFYASYTSNGVNTGQNHIFTFWMSDSTALPNPTVSFESQLVFEDA